MLYDSNMDDYLHLKNLSFFTVYTELQTTGQFEWMNMTVDEDEHSIEMHLPYIAKVMEE